MERIAEILVRKSPQFNTVSGEHFVNEALYQMCAENVDYLIVLEDDEKFSGILTQTDVVSKLLFLDLPLEQLKVKECMNPNLPVATMADSVDYCMQLMDQYNTRYIAIYDNFDFKGIISSHDLFMLTLNRRKDLELKEDHAYPYNY